MIFIAVFHQPFEVSVDLECLGIGHEILQASSEPAKNKKEAGHLVAMASNLRAMAPNVVAMVNKVSWTETESLDFTGKDPCSGSAAFL